MALFKLYFLTAFFQEEPERLRTEGLEITVQRLTKTLKDLRKQLQIVAMDQVSDVFRANDDHLILSSIKACSVSGDIDGVEQYIDRFREHAEHVQEVRFLVGNIRKLGYFKNLFRFVDCSIIFQ